MDAEEAPELVSLRGFYADLDPGLVESIWHEKDHDYKASMEALADIAKNPGAALARRGSSGDGQSQDEPRSPLRPPLSSSVAEVGTSHSSGADLARNPSWRREMPPAPAPHADSSWDMATVASALFDWGNSVSDGITGIADNISDFVSDLASAFDAGWDDGQEFTGGPHAPTGERNRAVVMAGGMDAQRVSNRRHPGTSAAPQTKVEWDGEEDEKKDA